MIKKFMYNIGILLLICMMCTFADTKVCKAASAQISISADSEEIKAGDLFRINILIVSDVAIGNFEANLIYDDELMQYNGGASVISGDGGFLHISDMNVLEGENSRKYSMEFEALKVGKATVEFYGDIMVYDLESDREMPVSSNILELDIKPVDTASTDARLKTMRVYPSGLNPEFDPDIYEYNINVGNDTKQLVITAVPFDTNATVSISGNQILNEGYNNVVISVLSESGDIIEYKIRTYREPAVVDKTPDITDSPVIMEDFFELIEENGRKFAIFGGKYEIIEPDAEIAIPEGYKAGSLTVSGVTIPAYIPVDNEQSEFVLVYARNEFGDKGFYKYDRIEKTLQRFTDTSSWVINEKTKSNNTADNNENMTKAVFVIVLLCGICIMMTFITVRMYIKLKGYKDDDLD